jgi:type IV pilus assembly protein PilW
MPRTLGRAAESGLSLIELMIAMVLALLVAAGIISVFISTSSSNRVQTQLASLQETGRFAISRMDGDLAMANGQYCTNNGGIAKPQLASSGTYLDGLRAPSVYASNLTGGMYDVTTPMGGSSGGNTYPTDPGTKYTFPSFLSMRGYDCTTTACTPIDPHDAIAAIPPMGTALGDRVPGTAVLTVRYINPSRGWTIGPGRSSIAGSGNVLSSITLNPDTTIGEPPASDFRNGDLAMLADCSNAQIFAADDASGVISPNTANNHGKPAMQQPSSAPKLFDFTRDFQTVTYYVKLVSINNDGTAPYTGALYRRVNGNDTNHGGSEDEIARGIERLDFKYGVENANGTTSFLTAAQVDASTAANCPPPAPTPLSTTDPGCLWRSVKSIEVSMLVDGQQPLYTLSADEMNYIYTLDGSGNALAAPSAHTIKPSDQGFVNQMLRRQFTALVSMRNFNP